MTEQLNPDSTLTTERALGAQRLAQYVARNRCGRYLRLALYPSEAKPLAARYRVGFETLSPLLSETGQLFERLVVEELSARERVRNLQNTSAAAFLAALGGQPPGRTIYYQARLEGRIGRVPCEGYPDLVVVERTENDSVTATVVDVKASRRETVGFRLQVAFYARLLADALAEAGLALDSLDGAIFHRGAGDRDAAAFDADKLEKFPLDLYLDEIEQLIARPDSDAAVASAAAFETAHYHLGPHCDGCPYNSLCFLDTAEREDLSLVPTLTATEKSALRAEGVNDARSLAQMLDYARGSMTPSAGREADCERAAARWPLGKRLPVLAQRARAALRRLDRQTEARPYLLTNDWGSLPDDAQYPNLVKVFVDAQRDHLQDRLYLLSCLVAGPQGAFEITELAGAPPDDDSERELLVAWVARALPAIARAADTESAPLHVYLFDRRGQRSLLDALARHFAALCAIPAFYDLLTSSPALTQGMISFLSDEVCGRLNLSSVCQNLYEVAREMGFRWDDGSDELTKTFHARVFDNTRPFARDAATRQLRPAEAAEPGAFFVESAARFGTEIPLEYAYAAWGLLDRKPDLKEAERGHLRQFLGTTSDDLRALASRRVRALRHVEQSFKYKSRAVEKQPLQLSRLDETDIDPGTVPLKRALEDFLYLEHHARTQELLLHLSLPPAERAQSGRTVVGRCESYEKNEAGELARFRLTNADGADLGAGGLPTLKLREGDWVVMNPIKDDEGRALPASRLIRGRLAVVEELTDAGFTLRLLPMSFRNSEFRYPHRSVSPEPGALYTADEMADDLNADKFLEACRNADSNYLYRWLCDGGEGKSPRAVRPKRLRDAAELAALASSSQSPHELTGAQRRVVGDLVRDRVVVLQGPPGTGKSHTLGFAVLARALALGTPSRPFRVAVCARTHAATSIALGSVARGAQRLKSH
ncbi:MAG TPA: PD-(D/E)XK nuclease family protein, partial [Pyrinomonadaceae bacterium]|nr:PD-(D/E)XK nuclease family protein [Pyrinomonadaceae bacterium]